MITGFFRNLFYAGKTLRLVWTALRFDLLDSLSQAEALSRTQRGRMTLWRTRLRFVARAEHKKMKGGEKLAAFLVHLGTSWIKLGQILASRGDLLGDEQAEALTHLHDALKPFPFEQAQEILEKELGTNWRRSFSKFDENPVSAASVAQVYRAVSLNGDSLAVKLLRPGVHKAFERNLAFLKWISDLLLTRFDSLKSLNHQRIVALLEQQTVIELDLRLEAAALDEFRHNVKEDSELLVPEVVWSLTTRQVLVMTWVEGIPIDEKEKLQEEGIALEPLMERAASVFFKTAFRDGYFHGDQHAGNMFVVTIGENRGKIAFVDFGIMGRLTLAQRHFLVDIIRALLKRDYNTMAERYQLAGYLSKDDSRELFAQAARSLCEPRLDRPLEEVAFAELMRDLLSMRGYFDFRLEPEFYILQKNTLIAEGVSRKLTPKMNLWAQLKSEVEDWLKKQRSPLLRVQNDARAYLHLVERLPDLVARADKALEQAENFAQVARPRPSYWKTPLFWLFILGVGLFLWWL